MTRVKNTIRFLIRKILNCNRSKFEITAKLISEVITFGGELGVRDLKSTSGGVEYNFFNRIIIILHHAVLKTTI